MSTKPMKNTIYVLPAIFMLLIGVLLWRPWDNQIANDLSTPPVVNQLPENGDPAEEEPKASHYTYGDASPDGIGKFYMGREISHVMGHAGISWLERSNREEEEAPSQAIEALDLAPDAVIADIGAGSGYYSFRLAELVPDGQVIALDIETEMLAAVTAKKDQLGVENITTHLGTIEDTKLPPDSIDAALMVDAYHEFSHPREMMESIVEALRPGGRVILLEYRAEDPNVPIKRLHKMSSNQAIKEMEAVGLKLQRIEDFLPWQHFMVFEKP